VTRVRQERLHLAQGVLRRAGRILLVASRYPNRTEPIWHLPGGRQRANELLPATLAREFREEVALDAVAGDVLYVSESFDRVADVHVLAVTFAAEAAGEPRVVPGDAHVRELAWVRPNDVPARIAVAVVRDPLVAYLRGARRRRYFGFAAADVSVTFADEA